MQVLHRLKCYFQDSPTVVPRCETPFWTHVPIRGSRWAEVQRIPLRGCFVVTETAVLCSVVRSESPSHPLLFSNQAACRSIQFRWVAEFPDWVFLLIGCQFWSERIASNMPALLSITCLRSFGSIMLTSSLACLHFSPFVKAFV